MHAEEKKYHHHQQHHHHRHHWWGNVLLCCLHFLHFLPPEANRSLVVEWYHLRLRLLWPQERVRQSPTGFMGQRKPINYSRLDLREEQDSCTGINTIYTIFCSLLNSTTRWECGGRITLPVFENYSVSVECGAVAGTDWRQYSMTLYCKIGGLVTLGAVRYRVVYFMCNQAREHCSHRIHLYSIDNHIY